MTLCCHREAVGPWRSSCARRLLRRFAPRNDIMLSSRGPQGCGDLLVHAVIASEAKRSPPGWRLPRGCAPRNGGDCFVASLLAMTLCCHREARRAVAISLPEICFALQARNDKLAWSRGSLVPVPVLCGFPSPDLRHCKAQRESIRIVDNPFTLRHELVQLCLRRQFPLDDPFAQRGRELNRQPHVGILVLKRDNRGPDPNVTKAGLSQHAECPCTGVEIASARRERRKDDLFEPHPRRVWRVRIPGCGVGLLDRDGSPWAGQRNHLAQQARVAAHRSKDEPDVGEVERFARKLCVVSILLKHFDVL